MSHLRISPRHLGQMNLGSFCPRCYWHQVQMGFKMPFDSHMPGIMFHLDRFEKDYVEAHFKTFDKSPKWLNALDLYSVVDFPAKMTMEFPKYDITMVGMPDAVFMTGSRKLCLVDYKSARYKGKDDPFLPAYEAQLLGYAHLLEHHGIGEVGSAALIYFENSLNEYENKPLDLRTDTGFRVPFTVKIHEVKINRPDLWPLLKKVREFADKRHPPAGLDKCKDCARLQALLDAEERRLNALSDVRPTDENYHRKVLMPMLMGDKARARVAWSDADDDPASDRTAGAYQDSMPASWDI